MLTLNEYLTFEHKSEHRFEHTLNFNLKKDPDFSIPKIYDANGDISKRWYVYFRYLNPHTGKKVRQKNIYGIANKLKTKEDRMYVLLHYRRELLKLLTEGYNPYVDNTSLFLKQIADKNSQANKVQVEQIKEQNQPIVEIKKEPQKPKSKRVKRDSILITSAFNKALRIKSKTMSSKTTQDYKYKIKKFNTWLTENHPEVEEVQHLTLDLVNDFLDFIEDNHTKRYRNNFRTDLGSLMQLLADREIIKRNFMQSIKTLKTKPQRHARYSKEQLNNIFDYLEKNDPILLLFIKFVSYNFVRPVEVCRITIGNINLEEKTVKYKAKNSPLKTKRIPDLLFNDLPDLSDKSENMFLFTPDIIGGFWETTENNRRDYFSKRFKKVKRHFGLDQDYTIYSFRHTFITNAYRKLEESNSPYEAVNKLMQITGHKSRAALEKYLRDVDAALPNDYSDLLKDE
ncbi:MAG: hypothetical protein BM564_03775 [Bacteroidetes bacterium MedPE-SWsnd-G2]|nr:MAG: hypothetical protein BM564_03775 [Bacteroidetes bacterium MedPE-SWsnd-G2]